MICHVVAYGTDDLVLRRVSSVCAGVFSMVSSIAPAAAWTSMDRSMGELEELKQCSPHLGDISLNE
jgi:hypothetical protein